MVLAWPAKLSHYGFDSRHRLVKIYLVIIQDRHVDIDIRLFRTLDEAVDFARNEVEERYWHHDSVEWDRWDKIDRDSDYHWSVGYSSESDRVSVISRNLPL